ncbi:MAG: hypothetical protein WC901_07020 [Candidatus Margulisiibacteriota bacterium]
MKHSLSWRSAWLTGLICWLLLGAPSAFCSTPFDYQFDSGTNVVTWSSPDPKVNLKIEGPYLALTSNASFPYIISPPLLCLADEYDTLIIRMKCSKKDTATIFWATDFDQQFNANKLVNFDLGSANRFHTYYINLRQQHPAWTSKILRLALSPFAGPGKAEIDYIQLEEENLFTNLQSGWAEFWGPKGRKTIGSTINVIKSTDFMGRPINVYVYAALLLVFIFSLAKLLQPLFTKPLKPIPKSHIKPKFSIKDWEAVGSKVGGCLIFFWILLELCSTYTYWNNFRADWQDYSGKSLEQKAAVSAGPDFYAFIQFCKSRLPKNGVDIGLIFPGELGSLDLKGRYYLYPNRLPENCALDKNTPYVLVYRLNNSAYSSNPNYYLFAKRSEDQYILKRKIK